MKREEIYAFIKEMGEYFRKKAARSDEDREKWSANNNSRICNEIAENHFRDPTKKASTTEKNSAATDPRPEAIRFFQKVCAAYDLEATGLPMTCPPWQELAKPYFEAAHRIEQQDKLLRDISAECKPLALLPAPLQRRIDAEIGGKQ